MGEVGTSEKSIRKRPHGLPTCRHVLDQRVKQVQEWLSEGQESRAIISKLRGKGIGVSTAYRYIAVARARWTASFADERPTILEQRLAHLRRLAVYLRKKEDHGAMVQIEKEINLILGVRAAERVDVRQAVVVAQAPQGAPPLDLSKLTDDQFASLKAAYGKLSLQGPAQPRGEVIDAVAVEEDGEG